MNLYPGWRLNLLVFSLIISFVGAYFYRQNRQASRELLEYSRNHSEILAAVVELNIRNALLSRDGLEDIVAASLENSGRFIHYLDSIEPFSSEELTAFAQESGLAGVKIIQPTGGRDVSGPVDWLPGKNCLQTQGFQRLDEDRLYLYSFLLGEHTPASAEDGCILVGLSSEKIHKTLAMISVERLLARLEDLHDIAYVRIESGAPEQVRDPLPVSGQEAGVDIMETVLPMGEGQLVVALKTNRFGKRRRQMQLEFFVFIGFLILFGAFSSWWLYRVQRQRLEETRSFERAMARQHEDAALGRAAATITHELRNPLNAIGMGLQRLQIEASNLERDHHNLLVSMRHAVDRSNRIISRLRQYTKSFEINEKPVDLSPLVTELLDLYRPQCAAQHITVSFAADASVRVSGDATLLEQLFENLLKNSVEAQPEGGFLEVSVRCERQAARVDIVNGGFELTPEESKLLFEPYFTTKGKGTGLGLVISNKIVQAHGGRLDWHVDRNRDRVCFTVTFPLISA